MLSVMAMAVMPWLEAYCNALAAFLEYLGKLIAMMASSLFTCTICWSIWASLVASISCTLSNTSCK